MIDLEDDDEMPSSFSSCRFLINLKLYSPLAAVLALFLIVKGASRTSSFLLPWMLGPSPSSSLLPPTVAALTSVTQLSVKWT